MACYCPLKGWYSSTLTASGKRGIVFDVKRGIPGRQLEVPCGQCIGCRLERSRQWAIRCVHEAQMHDRNCFITLTYDNEHYPVNGSLDVRHFQLFMKRLRKAIGEVRFFHCGEYGAELGRPHYHALLFGYSFDDVEPLRIGVGRSRELERLWPLGFSTVGDLTFESAAYVARYCTKKVTGKLAPHHYLGRKPEYVTMSRRPGIGAKWYARYSGDVFPSDEVVIRGGVVCKPPKFYDSLLEAEAPEDYRKMKIDRGLQARLNPENVPHRLMTRCDVKELNSKRLNRRLENA